MCRPHRQSLSPTSPPGKCWHRPYCGGRTPGLHGYNYGYLGIQTLSLPTFWAPPPPPLGSFLSPLCKKTHPLPMLWGFSVLFPAIHVPTRSSPPFPVLSSFCHKRVSSLPCVPVSVSLSQAVHLGNRDFLESRNPDK